MTPMEFTAVARRALRFVADTYAAAELATPSDITEALEMLDPEPEASHPLLRIGPGGDFVKDYPCTK